MSNKVKKIMKTDTITVGPFDGVRKAGSLMHKHRIGGLPVIENNKLIGIITSFDIRSSHPNRLVIDTMTSNPIFAKEDATLWEAKKLLEEYKIERLPVVSNSGSLIGIITKSVLYKELGKYFDLLTGLANSQLMIYKSINLFQENQDVVVLFLDIDNFGIFNKTHGHIIGDEIIKELSVFLTQFIEPSYLYRYGGDEFAAIIPFKIEKARLLAEKIASEVSSKEWVNNVSLSVSIGIAGGRRGNLRYKEEDIIENIKNLINLASLASTKAKKLKRDFVIADTLQLTVS